jgi:hypothetical protein
VVGATVVVVVLDATVVVVVGATVVVVVLDAAAVVVASACVVEVVAVALAVEVVTGAVVVVAVAWMADVVVGAPVVAVVDALVVAVVDALVVAVVDAPVVAVGDLVVVAPWCQDRWLGGVAPEVLLTAKELTRAATAIANTTPPARARRRRIGKTLKKCPRIACGWGPSNLVASASRRVPRPRPG